MATVHKSDKNSHRSIWIWLVVAIIFGLLAVHLLWSRLFFKNEWMVAAFFVSGIVANLAFGRFRANFSGFEGKDKTADFLGRRLPDVYHVLSAVPLVSADGQTGFADAVVVGPNGVFALVITNRNGTLSGGENGDWKQDKVGQKGGEYTVSFKNPIKRMKRMVWIAADMCKHSGVNAWVEGICYFSNKEATVQTASPQCMTNENDVIRHIMTFQPRRMQSKQDVLNLVEMFKERM